MDKKTAYVSTYTGPFQNSDCLIIEYDDVIEIPEFYFLCALIQSKVDLSNAFDVGNIYQLETIEEIIEWYVNRPCKELIGNFILSDNLIKQISGIYNTDDEYELAKLFSNDFLETRIIESDILSLTMTLNFFDVLKELLNTQLVKKVIIFSNHRKEFCENHLTPHLKSILREDIEVVSIKDDGFKNLLKENNITQNSTYVFSDLRHVTELEEVGLLERSSILAVDSYGYNYSLDGLVINLEELHNKYAFKFDFFNNYYGTNND